MSEVEDLKKELEDLENLLSLESKRLLDLKLQQEKLIKSNKIRFFVPSFKQEEFIKNADKKRRGVFAGNRFGKSTIGVIEDICWLLGYRPYYEESNPLRYLGIPQPGVKGLVIAQDWEKVKEIFTNNEQGDNLGKFFEWLPEGACTKVEKNSQGIINVIHVTSKIHGRLRKSIVYFDTVKSYKQDNKGAESSDWDFIHCDEPLPTEMWTAVSRGLMDRNGSAWFLLTSLNEAWIYDWVLEGSTSQPEMFYFLRATTDDNPTLSQEAKDAFFNSLTDEEKQARRNGTPLTSGRIVYNHFDRKTHVLDSFPSDWKNGIPPATYDIAVAIDPHPQTPHAVLFCAIAPSHVIFFSEIFVKCTFSDTRDSNGLITQLGLATRIKERIAGCNLIYMLCDPYAWIVDPETNRCWADTMREQGLPVIKAPKNKTAGIQEMNSFLANGFDKKIYFHRSLNHTLKEIQSYHYDRENKPVDKNDHLMECMYRLCSHDHFHYYGRSGEDSVKGEIIDDRISSLRDFSNQLITN